MNGEVIVAKDESELSFGQSFFSTLSLLKKHEPDLVLTCGYERPETFAAVLYARWFRTACFLMMDNQYEDHRRKRVIEAVKKLYLKLFDGYVYGGFPHHRYLIRLGVQSDKAVSGYNCVDNDAITSLAAEAREKNACVPPEEGYVLCIGRLIEKKNWWRLLLAYRQYVACISPEKQPWKLVIAGDGPMRGEIVRQVREVGLDEMVVMKGQVNSFDEIVRLNVFAKICVLASAHNEQWGLVVNEAMAAGRPVLVSEKCGCAEDLIRDGKNGFTFDPYSIQDLTEKLVWMHRHENRLEEMGRCGREIIENYSPRFFAEKIKRLYERVVQPSPDTDKPPRRKRVYLVGPLPPPIFGLSIINAAIRSQLTEVDISPFIIDLASSRIGRAWGGRLRRLAKVVSGFLHFLKSRPKAGDTLYMSVSGGFGQIYECLFAAVARLLGLRIWLHHHSYAYLDRKSRLLQWLASIAGFSATHIVLSAGMAARLRDVYPIFSRAITLSNAVFVEPFVPAAVRIRQSVETIGFLSNISEEKGVFDFLRVVSRLESAGWKVNARLAGPFDDGDTEKRVRESLQSVRTVEYVGPKYDDEKSAFFEELDVLLFPTRYVNEAMPVTILEAMAHGVPVIAFDRGSIGDLVAGGCGLVVDKNDDFAEAAVQQLRAWKASPETFQEVSKEVRLRFNQLREQSVSQWTALRTELCSSVETLTERGMNGPVA